MTTALESGKNVYCEKPLCVTMEDADNLVKAADKSKLVIQMGFQRRFESRLDRGKGGC